MSGPRSSTPCPGAAKQSRPSERSVTSVSALGSWPHCRILWMLLICLMPAVCSGAQPDSGWQRVPNTTLRMPANLLGSEALPATLADTGAFSDLVKLTPQPGIVPYDVNV